MLPSPTLTNDDIGLALAPFGVLAAGKLRTDEEEERRRETGEKGRMVWGPNWERTEDEKKMSKVLEEVAKEVGAQHISASECLMLYLFGNHYSSYSVRTVAIAYVLQKTPYVFPIIGGRKVEQLQANIEALSIALTPEQIAHIEGAMPFDPGFPTAMWVSYDLKQILEYRLTCSQGDGTKNNFLLNNAGTLDKWPLREPIRPQN